MSPLSAMWYCSSSLIWRAIDPLVNDSSSPDSHRLENGFLSEPGLCAWDSPPGVPGLVRVIDPRRSESPCIECGIRSAPSDCGSFREIEGKFDRSGLATADADRDRSAFSIRRLLGSDIAEFPD
jgi:hypothetical protein